MPVSGGEVIRCSVRQSGPNGQDIVNVWHYLVAAASPIDEEDVMADVAAGMDDLYATIQGQITNTQNPVDIKIDVVDYVGGVYTIIRNVGTIGWGASYNPSNTAEIYAAGVSILVLLRTLVGKVFGRKFIGVVGETTISNQNIATGDPASAFTAFIAKALEGFSTAAGEYLLGVMSDRLFDFALCHEVELATEVGYQRRRAPRSGS